MHLESGAPSAFSVKTAADPRLLEPCACPRPPAPSPCADRKPRRELTCGRPGAARPTRKMPGLGFGGTPVRRPKRAGGGRPKRWHVRGGTLGQALETRSGMATSTDPVARRPGPGLVRGPVESESYATNRRWSLAFKFRGDCSKP